MNRRRDARADRAGQTVPDMQADPAPRGGVAGHAACAGDDPGGDNAAPAGDAAAGAGAPARARAPDADRLDRLLAGLFPQLSRSRLQQVIRSGGVTVNGLAVVAPSAKIPAGADIVLTLPGAEPARPQPRAMPLDILHEDEHVIVVNKPAGMVVHPAAGHHDDTLVNALLAHCGDSLSGIGGVRRPGVVHRLDKDTSGVMVAAKNDRAHQALSAQFADHGRTGPLRRQYVALVWGAPARPRMTISRPLARSAHNREKIAVVPEGQGREAITHVTLEKVWGPFDAPASGRKAGEPVAALVRCELETGRTHQIRVHMAAAGHPLLGDALYGAGFATRASRLPQAARDALAALGRQALHARSLAFAHPATGETLAFEAPPPADMQRLIDALDAAAAAADFPPRLPPARGGGTQDME